MSTFGDPVWGYSQLSDGASTRQARSQKMNFLLVNSDRTNVSVVENGVNKSIKARMEMKSLNFLCTLAFR
ncbi:hypothetical protein H6G91_21420 [Nostoc muscorum FACHB-395]|nr:hypothetical protein [Desmonostoc muscorum FACHB-395]